MFASLIFLLSLNAFSSETLIDKIIAVINTRVVSLSELNRIDQTLNARKEIAPFIYNQPEYKQQDLLMTVIHTYIIRDKLSSQGYVISDDHVESRIKMTEENLGLNRASLLNFLKSKNITFEEYFEIIRESMEYNIFATRIIGPLITITDQELKNEFYRKNSANRALSFTYDLISFSIDTKTLSSEQASQFSSVIKDYQLTGRLPQAYSSMDTSTLDAIKGDSLNPELSKLLEKSLEGEFTASTVVSDRLHIFFVKAKNMVESQAYLANKDRIQEQLFAEKSVTLTKSWFEREFSNYYIKNFL